MSLPLYMDVHVPFSITSGLRLRGVDVLTAQEDGTTLFNDEALLLHATARGRVMFSMDEDMLIEAQQFQQAGRPFSGVFYAHQLNVTIGQCVLDLELFCKAGARQDLANSVEFLPL